MSQYIEFGSVVWICYNDLIVIVKNIYSVDIRIPK